MILVMTITDAVDVKNPGDDILIQEALKIINKNEHTKFKIDRKLTVDDLHIHYLKESGHTEVYIKNPVRVPDNDRSVLAWVRDKNDLESWIIDSYIEDYDQWTEAKAWDLEVLYWCELPQPPKQEK